jgi:phosphomevalonate kinase
MATIDHIRNGIINKLLTISNKNYLAALSQLVENSSTEKDTVKLTEEQTLMLQLSDNDIKTGKLINQAQLDKRDLKWLKEL